MDEDSKKEAERLRKATYRAKLKSKSEGTYVQTPIELAKELLDAMKEPDANAPFQDQNIGPHLKPEDKKVLQNYVYNLKIRRRREDEEEARRIEKEQLISEKGRMLLNQKTYDLHQSLLMPMMEDERVKLIKDSINSNIFLFLEYMESYMLPSNDFLRIVVSMKEHLEPAEFTELFVRVCTYQKIEELKVTTEMVNNAIAFLVEKKRDDKAAYGLLRLIYLNDISLSGFSRTLLIKFQEDYQQTILRFFKSITPMETQVAESLPASAFCFTSPVLKVLKNEGKAFSTQIPYQFMPFLVHIVCFSFTESESSFIKFLEVFKSGMKDHFNTLGSNKFTDLLQRILDETIAMKPLFFSTLDTSASILQRAFQLLNQRQIHDFNQQVIQNLITGDLDTLKQMAQAPRIIPQNSQMKLAPILKELRALNPSLSSELFSLDKEIDQESIGFFKAVGIEVPLPLQILCFNFCTTVALMGRWLVQLDTGTGKTALCYTIGCAYACQGFKVVIINGSEELTFRDYEKGLKSQKSIQMQICFLSNNLSQAQLTDGLNYISFKNFSALIQKLSTEELKKLVVIADEYDQIYFGENNYSFDELMSIRSISTFIGLSGSDLKDPHIKSIEEFMGGRIFKMNINDVFKPAPKNVGVDVYSRITDYRDVIQSLCTQQVISTPVILIANDDRLLLTRKLKSAGIPVETLFQQTFTESNGALSVFTRKQGGKYSVYIINDTQGRGLDFPTTTEIEDAGGVYLIVGKLPSSFLQFKQFLGRTGRMGNKSQYCVVLHDADAKNEEGNTYLEKKLEILHLKDLQRASSLQNLIRDSEIQSKEFLQQNANSDQLEGEKVKDKSQISDRLNQDQGNAELVIENEPQQQEDEKVILTLSENVSANLDGSDEEIKESSLQLRKREKKATHKEGEKIKKLLGNNERETQLVDAKYYESYSRAEIHEEMCSDKRRLISYEIALQKVAAGKNVIDVGAGTGVLSFYAAQAGASLVHAIEKSGIVSKLKKEINKRQLKQIVKVMNCTAEEAPLDGIKCDILVSEWMGYFLLCERMLPSVISVRDRCLSQDGLIIPCRARILVAAADCSTFKNLKQYSQEGDAMRLEAMIQTVPSEQIISDQTSVLEISLKDVEENFDSFEAKFVITISKAGSINALVAWFDVEMTPNSWFSTSPFEPATHWEQTVLPIIGSEKLEEGAQLAGQISCRPQLRNHRGLDIDLSIGDIGTNQPLRFSYNVQ